MNFNRLLFTVVRKVVGCILVAVAVPAVIGVTWQLSRGNELVLGHSGMLLLGSCAAVALIGASMVGKIRLPTGRRRPPSDPAGGSN